MCRLAFQTFERLNAADDRADAGDRAERLDEAQRQTLFATFFEAIEQARTDLLRDELRTLLGALADRGAGAPQRWCSASSKSTSARLAVEAEAMPPSAPGLRRSPARQPCHPWLAGLWPLPAAADAPACPPLPVGRPVPRQRPVGRHSLNPLRWGLRSRRLWWARAGAA